MQLRSLTPDFKTIAVTMPLTARLEPTDMSNAPHTMTIVMPMTISPSLEELSRIASAFATLKKRGLHHEKKAMESKTDAKIVNSRMRNWRPVVAIIIGKIGEEQSGLPQSSVGGSSFSLSYFKFRTF
jgi:hypothetical protein